MPTSNKLATRPFILIEVEVEVKVEVEGKENSFFALLVITSRKAVYRSCPSWFMI